MISRRREAPVTTVFNFCSVRRSQEQERQEALAATSAVVEAEGRRPFAPRHRSPRFDLVQGFDHRKVGAHLVGHHRAEEAAGAQALVFLWGRRPPIAPLVRLWRSSWRFPTINRRTEAGLRRTKELSTRDRHFHSINELRTGQSGIYTSNVSIDRSERQSQM